MLVYVVCVCCALGDLFTNCVACLSCGGFGLMVVVCYGSLPVVLDAQFSGGWFDCSGIRCFTSISWVLCCFKLSDDFAVSRGFGGLIWVVCGLVADGSGCFWCFGLRGFGWFPVLGDCWFASVLSRLDD